MPTDTTHHIVAGRRTAHPNRRTSSAQHRPVGFRLAAAAAVAAVPLMVTSPAGAAGRVVHPGESIQAALDAARPGDTITVAAGTYHESITITTDHVTLVGAGLDKTHLRPAAEADNPCAAEHFGVCIIGQLDDNLNVIRPVEGVRLSSLSVSGFGGVDQAGEPVGAGVFVLGGHNTTIDHVVAADNAVFGFTSILSSADRYRNDTAHDNGYAGFQIAEAAGRGHRLQHVVAYANRYGIFVHDASAGVVADAALHDNCVGALLFGPATTQWEMMRTTANTNNRTCPALPGSDPASSGAGIAIVGADHVTIGSNTVTGNRPAADSFLAGGIVVGSTPTGDQPNHITVTHNQAEANRPADIVWDGTGTRIAITNNDCHTSLPDGLCG